jgi:hypothetical protein
MAELYLAGGCFWGMEKYLASIRGVSSTQVGYANGKTEGPTYEEVCRNDTGHAETVRVTYDPSTPPGSIAWETPGESSTAPASTIPTRPACRRSGARWNISGTGFHGRWPSS